MTEENHGFDFETALRAIQEGKPLIGKEGILTPSLKIYLVPVVKSFQA